MTVPLESQPSHDPTFLVNQFREWLTSNNIDHSLLEIAYTPSQGYHFYAKTDLEPETTIVSIPKHMLLSTETAYTSQSFSKVIKNVSYDLDAETTTSMRLSDDAHEDEFNTKDTLTVLLFLLHEMSKGTRSFWHPYISLLPGPKQFTTPLFFPDDLIQGPLLQTPLYAQILDNKVSLQGFFDATIPALYELFGDEFILKEYCTFEWFLWAYSCVDSRAFKFRLPVSSLPSESNSTNNESSTRLVVALCPLADLANHTTETPNIVYRGSQSYHDGIFKLVTKSAITASSELMLKYNNFSNSELLLYYGFAVPGNALESIDISLDMDDEEDDGDEDKFNVSVKRALFMQLGQDIGLGYSHRIGYELSGREDQQSVVTIPKALLASLRILLMTSAELKQLSVQNLDSVLEGSAIVTLETETKVLETLGSVLLSLGFAFDDARGQLSELAQVGCKSTDEQARIQRLGMIQGVDVYLGGLKTLVDKALQEIGALSEEL